MRVPEKKPCDGALFRLRHSAAAVMIFFSSCSVAAEWSVVPRLSLWETYSDNIRLGRVSGDRDDFVTQINPGVTVNGTARRFNLDASYMMNNLIYAKSDDLSRMRHQLTARGTAELYEDWFFVDGRAAITQQNISPLGPQAIDNVNVTGNRADVRTYSVSPYLRHRFQDFASGEVRYMRNYVNSNANALFNSHGDSVSANLSSGTAFPVFRWGLSYSNQMITFDRTGRTVELERSIANLGYRVTSQFSLTATGGYERNSFISIRNKHSSPTWTVGFIWMPSERTNIIANAGQRFFGDTYFVQASHRTRLMVWDASYDENITTFNQQAQQGGGAAIANSLSQLLAAQNPGMSPGLIQQNAGALLGLGLSGAFFDPNNFFTNRLFLQKRLQASVAMNGSKNTVVLRAFNMTRNALSAASDDFGLFGAANAALLSHTRQTGGNALWSYRLTNLTRANLNFGYTRYAFLGVNREDDHMLVRLSLSRQFPEIMRNLTGVVEVRHNQRDSNQPGANYRENGVVLALNMTF